jgi:hypothetical protein
MIDYLIGPLLTLACAAVMLSYWAWRTERRRRAWVAAFEADLTAWREEHARESAAWHAEQDRKAAEWHAEWDRKAAEWHAEQDRKAAEWKQRQIEADGEYRRVVAEIERDIGGADSGDSVIPQNGHAGDAGDLHTHSPTSVSEANPPASP